MRIAWFTPFDPTSAIGAFSDHVTALLARYAAVELWVPEGGELRQAALPLVRFGKGSLDAHRLADMDMVIYNLGNSFGFHRDITAVARVVPGVVILHDSVLHHFFLDEARVLEGAIDPYLGALTRWYGEHVAHEARAQLEGVSADGYPTNDFAAAYPLLEEATLGALGLVVHSDAQVRRVSPYWTGPVARLDLPCREAELAIGPVAQPSPASDGRLRLLSFGLVNEPKQIHLIVDALGSRASLRERVRYRIAGPYDAKSEYFARLEHRIAEHGLEGAVEVLGYVTDDQLRSLTDWADCFVNLRWPSTEGGSASLAQQLITGKPVVVSRSGVFDELPDDAAVKLRSHDAEGVADAIEMLLYDPTARVTIGTNGRRLARRFTADAYVRGILRVAREAAAWRVPARTIDRVGDLLRELGAPVDLAAIRTVGSELSHVVGAEFTPGPSLGA